MSSRRDEPLPYEVIRDLLGFVRAMYRAAKARGASRHELEKLARIGKDLTEAIDLGVSTRPGTLGHKAAWARAEEATRALGDFVDAMTPAEPLLETMRAQVIGSTRRVRSPRHER